MRTPNPKPTMHELFVMCRAEHTSSLGAHKMALDILCEHVQLPRKERMYNIPIVEARRRIRRLEQYIPHLVEWTLRSTGPMTFEEQG